MLVQRNLPHEIEDVVVQEKRKEEEGGRRRNALDKSSQKWQPSFSQGGREKIEKDVSHRSHGTEEPATLVVVVVAVVFVVVVSRERDRVIYIEAGKRPFTKTVMKKEERNDEFSMRGTRGAEAPFT